MPVSRFELHTAAVCVFVTTCQIVCVSPGFLCRQPCGLTQSFGMCDIFLCQNGSFLCGGHGELRPLFATSAPALITFLFLKTLLQGIDTNYQKKTPADSVFHDLKKNTFQHVTVLPPAVLRLLAPPDFLKLVSIPCNRVLINKNAIGAGAALA